LLDELGVARPLLAADREALEASGAGRILRPLLETRFAAVFSDFAPNPERGALLAGLELLRDSRADGVVALGGGTAADLGKLLATFAAQSTSIDDALARPESLQPVSLPLVAVPTTAGSGSEATSFAVLYADGRKHSLGHAAMRPAAALVDPVLTESCPPRLTACAGLDALCQAIESFWSAGATRESRDYALAALRPLVRQLRAAVHAPTPKIRVAMADAAHLAGRAIQISKTTAPHALSYALTARYGVPHGHAVALTIGEVFAANAAAPDALVQLPGRRMQLRGLLDPLLWHLGADEPAALPDYFRTLLADLGLETRLRDLNVPRERLPELAAAADPARLANNPVRLSPETILEIYQRAW
jgi:alcohol dehydrogenase class IV